LLVLFNFFSWQALPLLYQIQLRVLQSLTISYCFKTCQNLLFCFFPFKPLLRNCQILVHYKKRLLLLLLHFRYFVLLMKSHPFHFDHHHLSEVNYFKFQTLIVILDQFSLRNVLAQLEGLLSFIPFTKLAIIQAKC
jgi:hypothetical protein